MRIFRKILSLVLLAIFIAFLLSIFFDLLFIKIVVVILVLISTVGELINVITIKKKLKTGELKTISLSSESSTFKILWLLLLIFWLVAASISCLHDFNNFLNPIINIYTCLIWLYFRKYRRDFLFFDENGISYSNLFESCFLFKDIQHFEFDGKRIILNLKKGMVQLPKYKNEANDEIIELLKEKELHSRY